MPDISNVSVIIARKHITEGTSDGRMYVGGYLEGFGIIRLYVLQNYIY